MLPSRLQVQLKGLVLGVGSAQEQAYASLASMEINNQIQKTTQDELAAYVTFAAGASPGSLPRILRQVLVIDPLASYVSKRWRAG